MRKRIFEHLMLWFIKDNQFPYVLRTFWRYFRWWYNEDNIPSAMATIIETFDECIDEDNRTRGDIIHEFCMNPPKYWYKQGIGPGKFIIMKREEVFMNLSVNGHYPTSRQARAVAAMCDSLNRANP